MIFNNYQQNNNSVPSNNIINEYSFNCIPRYFISEGYLSLDYSGKECEIGIALKDFLNIKTGSIVSIERQGQTLIIKSYNNSNMSLYDIQRLLKLYINDFDKYPNDGIYNENIFHFKLMLTQDN